MDRLFSSYLVDWLGQAAKKPLILRGARQVGKTWLVRDLARRTQRDLIELNFERNPEYRKYFAGNNPTQILGDLSLLFGKEITVSGSLLFLDEIQAAGEILAKLRWFAEELPALPIIAAGSLLEFTLADHDFSMPVGRVSFRHAEPMSFAEFLNAHGQGRLLKGLAEWKPGQSLTPAAHERAGYWFERYTMVGGMPAVVAADISGETPIHCREIQKDLTASFRADFSKYRGRLHADILDSVLRAVAGSVGRKFVYAQADTALKQHQVKQALELLVTAQVCQLIRYSAANGLPLGSETKDTFRKVAFLDIGIFHALLNTPAASAFPALGGLTPDMRARISEQMATQQLRHFNPSGTESPEVYYWQREGGRPGEIDFLVPCHGRIIPIELKSGAAGSMKGLHQFMYDKGLGLAVRVDGNPPSDMQVAVSTTQGNPVRYKMVSVPLYLLWNLPNILDGDL